MSGGSYTIDPKTGQQVRSGTAHQRPTRAERRSAQHAAEADQAAADQANAEKGRKGRKGRGAKAPEPIAPEAAGDQAGTATSTSTEE